jgi:hypothetical protein
VPSPALRWNECLHAYTRRRTTARVHPASTKTLHCPTASPAALRYALSLGLLPRKVLLFLLLQPPNVERLGCHDCSEFAEATCNAHLTTVSKRSFLVVRGCPFSMRALHHCAKRSHRPAAAERTERTPAPLRSRRRGRGNCEPNTWHCCTPTGHVNPASNPRIKVESSCPASGGTL